MMKRKILSLFLLFQLAVTSHASLMVENVYKKVYIDSASFDLNFGPIVAPIFTFNYFNIPGSCTITGKLSTEVNSMLLADPIGGGNYHPSVIYNNSYFKSQTNYYRNPIFIHNNSLTFTNLFQGKGNNYIGARAIFPGTNDTVYFWILINLNAAGTELNILKIGYEDENGVFPLTGNEGQNNPTGLNANWLPELKVYPNPARDFVQIELPETLIGSLSVYNLNGSLMHEAKQIQDRLQVAEWPRGIYLLRVETGDAVLTRKLILE